jgi:two-component system LytT family response regulator
MYPLAPDKINALIIEDNSESSKELESLLMDFDEIRVVGEAQNGKEAIALINQSKPDLVFLDIQLPGMDGFEVLQKIDHYPMIIFVTAFHQYAVKAFEVNGIDYLLKPITKTRLERAVKRVINFNKTLDTRIMEVLEYILKKKHQEVLFSVKEGDQILVIPLEEVYYFKAEDQYTFLYTEEKKYFYNSTLKELMAMLDADIFCRINRSCIVALNKIKKLKKGFINEYKVILSDSRNTAIKISKNHYPELKKKLNIRLKF